MCWYSFSSSCNTSSCFRTDSCWNSPRSTCTGAKHCTLWVWVTYDTLPFRVNMHFETEGFHHHSLLPEMCYLLAVSINSVSLNVFYFSWQKCRYASELSSFLCTSLKNCILKENLIQNNTLQIAKPWSKLHGNQNTGTVPKRNCFLCV